MTDGCGGMARKSTAQLAKSLRLDADVTFAEPWEAKAFAIVVKLAEAGHFTWREWVECFAREVAAATAVEAEGGVPKTLGLVRCKRTAPRIVERGSLTRATQPVRARAFQALSKFRSSFRGRFPIIRGIAAAGETISR
jgi:hypothetical protein